jgi:hypothetical protein|tara:strand:+ start:226 stop:447 length:222 start_codon:yes stop_codon:yes gene_type:complete
MQIDTDIPIPSKRFRRASKYAWAEAMEVGHSVRFTDVNQAHKVYMALRKRWEGEREWILRSQEDGAIRIWRKL